MIAQGLLKDGNKCDRNEWSLSGKGSLTRVEVAGDGFEGSGTLRCAGLKGSLSVYQQRATSGQLVNTRQKQPFFTTEEVQAAALVSSGKRLLWFYVYTYSFCAVDLVLYVKLGMCLVSGQTMFMFTPRYSHQCPIQKIGGPK